jgi:hypothetical protein
VSKTLGKALIFLLVLLPLAYPASAQITVPLGGSLSIPDGGALNLGCTDLIVQGSASVGSGQISRVATINIAAYGVLNGGQGTINVGSGWNNAGTFVPGSGTVVLSDDCSAAPVLLTGATTFYNLTLTSTSGGTFVLPAGNSITVNGTLTLHGLPGFPIQLVSYPAGQPTSILLGPDATVASSNASVSPLVHIGEPVSVPTLNAYGLFILALLLLAITVRYLNVSRRCTPVIPQGDSRHGL